MKEQYQSLTVALDHVTAGNPSPSIPVNDGQLKRQRDLLLDKNKPARRVGAQFDLSRTGVGKKFSLKKIGSTRTEQERSVQLRTIELKKYLAHLTSKHTAQMLQERHAPDYNYKTGNHRPKRATVSNNPAVKFKQKQYKLTHSLPHIPSDLHVSSRTVLKSRRAARLDSEVLPTRLTSYGLAALQERIYKIDTSYRHAPFTYHSSSYGHPYVSDELFERITDWIRNVNISVDWASVVQNANDLTQGYHGD